VGTSSAIDAGDEAMNAETVCVEAGNDPSFRRRLSSSSWAIAM